MGRNVHFANIWHSSLYFLFAEPPNAEIMAV